MAYHLKYKALLAVFSKLRYHSLPRSFMLRLFCRYVVRKDTDWNVVYASKSYSSDDKARNEFYCSNVNWLQKPNSESQLYCKIRHGPDFYECEIEEITEEGFKVVLGRRDQGLAPGQYAAFYQDDVCLGCGVIETDVLCREKYVK